MRAETLLEKIKALSPESLAEVENFVDFIAQHDELRLAHAATKLSEEAFRRIWGNEEDVLYDQL